MGTNPPTANGESTQSREPLATEQELPPPAGDRRANKAAVVAFAATVSMLAVPEIVAARVSLTAELLAFPVLAVIALAFGVIGGIIAMRGAEDGRLAGVAVAIGLTVLIPSVLWLLALRSFTFAGY